MNGPEAIRKPPKPEVAGRRRERRIVMLASSVGFLLFLVVFTFLPNAGPVFRVFTNPSASMVPSMPVGTYSIVSRASYGYSRHSFDFFSLPIDGRWPAWPPSRGDIAVFRNAEDEVFALADRCPHKGGPLSQGIVFGRRVACPLHNWTIQLEDGGAAAPDAGCAMRYAVRIEAGEVFLRL